MAKANIYVCLYTVWKTLVVIKKTDVSFNNSQRNILRIFLLAKMYDMGKFKIRVRSYKCLRNIWNISLESPTLKALVAYSSITNYLTYALFTINCIYGNIRGVTIK